MEAYNCYVTLSSYVFLKVAALASGSVSKESACNAGDLGLIPGLGRSPGRGNTVFLPGKFHEQKILAGYGP